MNISQNCGAKVETAVMSTVQPVHHVGATVVAKAVATEYFIQPLTICSQVTTQRFTELTIILLADAQDCVTVSISPTEYPVPQAFIVVVVMIPQSIGAVTNDVIFSVQEVHQAGETVVARPEATEYPVPQVSIATFVTAQVLTSVTFTVHPDPQACTIVSTSFTEYPLPPTFTVTLFTTVGSSLVRFAPSYKYGAFCPSQAIVYLP